MALPTVSKTWQYCEQQIAAQGTMPLTNQTLMKAIVDSLLGTTTYKSRANATITPTGVWTCVGSSDKTTAGLDGVYRWSGTTTPSWVNSGAAAWVVLQNAGIDPGGKFQLLLHLFDSGVNSYNVGFQVSVTGFGTANGGSTNGSTTTLPTSAAAGIVAQAGGGFTASPSAWATTWGGADTAVGTAVTTTVATDGSTRVFMCRNSKVVSEWIFDALAQPQSGWTHPFLLRYDGVSTSAPSADIGTTATWMSAASTKNVGFSSAQLLLQCTSEGNSSAPLFTVLTGANAFSGQHPLFGVGVYSAATSVGRHALLADMQFGLTALSTGQCYPITPAETREFAQFGFRVVPWKGTVPLITA